MSFASPLARYISKDLDAIFSPRNRILIWRKLWLGLAEAEKELNAPITDEQIQEMRDKLTDIDLNAAAEIEAEKRHDVMAHLELFCRLCPTAAPIIHLGATSCYITDNADIILTRQALQIISTKLYMLVKILKKLSIKYIDVPCLGYTHLQPAQPITLGRRFCNYLQDLTDVLNDMTQFCESVKFRGAKGTVGSEATFNELFGDECRRLDELLCSKFGFKKSFALTTQTYPRNADHKLVCLLSVLAATINKVCLDIRLLSQNGQVSENFGKNQVGSSAMPYKQNPTKSERCCGLARHLGSLLVDSFSTASMQMLERTLDDSSSRRMFLPESLIISDAIIELLANILKYLNVNEKRIASALSGHLPYMAVESIIIVMVKKYKGDRQTLHEALRRHAVAARSDASDDGGVNSGAFFDLIKGDPLFAPIVDSIDEYNDPMMYIGRSQKQVLEYMRDCYKPLMKTVRPLIKQFRGSLGDASFNVGEEVKI